MSKKNIFFWTLYDFANSIVAVVFFLYFSQWLVIDHGVSDFWYNMIFTVASLLLLLTAPVLGSMADRTGRRHQYLSWITMLTFFFFLATSLVTLFLSGSVMLATLFFLLASYLYQFSFVFYNALLHDIAPPEKWGLVSGLGQTGNWLGQIFGLVITLPFAGGTIYLLGEPGRVQAFLPAVIVFFLLTLPMLFLFKLPGSAPKHPEPRISYTEEYRLQWGKFKQLVKAPDMGRFLLAYLFFNDAILTATNNFPLYLERVFSVSDTTKTLILLGILITSAVGALVSGWVTDKIGLRKSLLIVLGSWIVLFPILGMITDLNIFMGVTAVMGFLFGAVWTVTRAVMTALCPPDQLNFGFSFYTLAERVSTLIGPFTWGLIVSLFVDLGSDRYRIAVISMTVFVIIGFYIVRKIHLPSHDRLPENV